MNGIIYSYRFKPTGNFYIGQTTNPAKRHAEHISGKSKQKFGRTMNKYGQDFFEYEVLMRDIPENELDDWECYFIWLFQSYVRVNSNGFNLTQGGDFDREFFKFRSGNEEWRRNHIEGLKRAYIANPELRAKRSALSVKQYSDPEYRKNAAERLRLLHKDPEYQKNHEESMERMKSSVEWRKNQSEGAKRMANDPHWQKNHKEGLERRNKDPEWQENNRRSLKERWTDQGFRTRFSNAIAKKLGIPVVCIETGVVYESAQEAQRQTGIYQASISAVCRSVKKTAGGYTWRKANEEETKNVKLGI